MAGTLENNFYGISMDKSDVPDDTKVIIRASHNPLTLFGRPVAVVNCACGKKYKKNIYYESKGNFNGRETLTCPDSGCGRQISLSYSEEW